MPSEVPTQLDYANSQIRIRRRHMVWIITTIVVLFVAAIPLLIPTLQRSKYEMMARRCPANMRQIGMAILLYANENQRTLPPDLVTLVATQGVTLNDLICPMREASTAALSPLISDPAARSTNHLDYIYVGEGLLSNVATAEDPILFERLADHDHDGGNVLFGDGHVEFMTKPQILKLLEPLRNTPRLTEEEYNAIVAK